MTTEPTNEDRAEWARKSLWTYVEETRYGSSDYELEPDNKDNNEEVIGDFLSDLRHLCDALGIDWDSVNSSGAMHHREEVAEARIAASKDLTAEIQELLAPDPWGQAEAADARKRDAEQWTVRKQCRELQAGDRIIFTEEMGGEGETVTVEVVTAIMGGALIHTEELDFAIASEPMKHITMAPEGDK